MSPKSQTLFLLAIPGLIIFLSGCTNPPKCIPKTESRCYNGNIYWYDSCGKRGDMKEYCQSGCSEDACIQKIEQACVLLEGTGNDAKINLFFIPAHGATSATFPAYENKVKSLAEELFRVPPLDKNRDRLNFYFVANQHNFNCEVGSQSVDQCNEKDIREFIVQTCQVPESKIHQVIAFRTSGETGGNVFEDKPGYGSIFFNMSENGIVLAHELGHSMANFGDEYFAGSVRGAVQLGAVNTDKEGCSKWCSGKLDESNEFYEYYAGWKNCVLSKGLNLNPTQLYIVPPGETEAWNSCWDEWAGKYYNAANPPGILKKCPYNANGSIANLTLGQTINASCADAKTFDNMNLGEGCMGSTGCYFTGFGVNVWRQLENSIMRTDYSEGARFGDYSDKILQEVIDNLTSMQ